MYPCTVEMVRQFQGHSLSWPSLALGALFHSTPGAAQLQRGFHITIEFFLTLRAKGTQISEPRFSTPCEMRFFPCEKGKMAFVEGFSSKRPFSLSRAGKIASRRGSKIGAH